MSFKDEVIKVSRKKILFTQHAVEQMNKPTRLISPREIESVVFEGEIIEDYPNDIRGHSCLLSGLGEKGRTIHVVCAPKTDYLAIITAYLPNDKEWQSNFKKRRR